MARRWSEDDRADRLAQRLEDKTLLVAELEHSMKSAFMVVSGWASMIEGDWDRLTEAQRREGVAAIRRKSDEMTELSLALLREAQAESTTIQVHLRRVDIRELLEDLSAERTDIEAGRNLEMSTDVDVVITDEVALKAVLTELLDNAIKYSWDGCTVRVTVRPSGDDGTLIDVEDDGLEIPAEVDVFAPFTRGGAPSEVAGSGMGLYIARRAVRALGGELTAHRRPGGSRFAVWLPGSRLVD